MKSDKIKKLCTQSFSGVYTPEAAIVMVIVLSVILACFMLSFDLYSENCENINQCMSEFEFDAPAAFWFADAVKNSGIWEG